MFLHVFHVLALIAPEAAFSLGHPTEAIIRSEGIIRTDNVAQSAERPSGAIVSDTGIMEMSIDSDGSTGSLGAYDFDVDVVYTWVKAPDEGSDAWSEIRTSCGAVDVTRYRNLDTMIASLSSLKSSLPWVRKIFIVTAGEVPCWKDALNLPIEMVTHKQIYPTELQSTDLPSHNSVAIETHLHRIPGLAEHFVYFNNDFFVGKALDKSFFFAADGKVLYDSSPKDVGAKAGGPARGKMPNTCASPMVSTHQANAFRKSAIEEHQKSDPAHFKSLSKQRCRGDLNGNVPPFWSYMCYHADHGYAQFKAVSSTNAFLTRQNMLFSDAWYAMVLKERPARFCINDDFDTSPGSHLQSQEKALADFLHQFLGTTQYQTLAAGASCDSSLLRDVSDWWQDWNWFAKGAQSDNIGEPDSISLNIPDIPNLETVKKDVTSPAADLNEEIMPTLKSLEVRVRGDHLPPACGAGMRIAAHSAKLGQTWGQSCAMLRAHPDLAGTKLLFLNDMDNGMARTRNEDTTALLANCLGMDYVYGVEFVELTEGKKEEYTVARDFGHQNTRSLRGNAILSAYPLTNFDMIRLPGTEEYWHKDGANGTYRLGGRMAIFATMPVVDKHGQRSGSVEVVSTHLDAFAGDTFNELSSELIAQQLVRRGFARDNKDQRAIVAGNFASAGRQSKAADYFVQEANFQPTEASYPAHCELCNRDWLMLRGLSQETSKRAISSQGHSDHGFVSLDISSPCA
jgi:endonuclease/exonuclease/phosphatase family metal-dependent hydrolase